MLIRALPRKFFRFAAGLALAVPTLGCTPARVLNALITDQGYRVERDIAYGDASRQKLDVYLPDDVSEKARVAVFFYGGRWQFGSKADYLFVGQALASRGIVTVIADYRLYPNVRFPDFVQDGAKAIGWVRRHIGRHGGDADSIFLLGHSAGAYIAAMLALDAHFLAAENIPVDDLAGWIGLAGPYDFLPITDPDVKEVFATDDLASTQPITHAVPDAPVTLLLTGEQDETVLPRNSLRLGDAINEAGGQADVETYERVGHVGVVLALASPFRWLAPVLDDVIAFIERERPISREAASKPADRSMAAPVPKSAGSTGRSASGPASG